MKEKIIILDTTLRDGEQSLRSSMSIEEKLNIALSLEDMGVDFIEAGFPVSSPGDFKAVQTISNTIKNSRICSLARCIDKDIDIAAESMNRSKYFRIHVFLGTSNLHVTSKLQKTFTQIIEMAVKGVKRAKRYTDDVEFSCEDAGRTSIQNLCRIIESVIDAGATTINIPDTVGYTIPSEYKKIILQVRNEVHNIDKAVISVHCHDDLGMATGNSISALEAGARQIEGTINGIGERAGNTALEEVILAIKIKEKLLNVYTSIKISNICNTSKIVSSTCGISIPENKAIIGNNAFSHSSGIHQDGVLKNRKNYEIIFPEDVGFKTKQLHLTSRSGRAAIKFYMDKMGYKEVDYNLNLLYKKFLKLSDKIGQVFDYHLEILSFLDNQDKLILFFLKSLKVKFSCNKNYMIFIELLYGKKILKGELLSKNNNLVNSIIDLIVSVTKIPIILNNYNFLVQMKNKEEIGIVNISVLYKKRIFYSKSFSISFSEAIVKSLINILNDIEKYNKAMLLAKST
ncbi:2-isopropylmalate synthase [Buchnera aphidicola]|uniref:2-isopropylmalate synthase n=1 Tax=Buchnera aphidicola (Anoecia oenotherae) TaxID=1241833 RepID=A0A4D6XQR9_9GAMM|nr:2-isopropylmalate synthase [Buchnera aphidicola]QCI19353.1 2-isopropylmalate synthase [Buchnera aphidicola (Anoecia oenotherae)]